MRKLPRDHERSRCVSVMSVCAGDYANEPKLRRCGFLRGGWHSQHPRCLVTRLTRGHSKPRAATSFCCASTPLRSASAASRAVGRRGRGAESKALKQTHCDHPERQSEIAETNPLQALADCRRCYIN